MPSKFNDKGWYVVAFSEENKLAKPPHVEVCYAIFSATPSVATHGQIEAQVMKPGMVAEATCISKPWVIIPLVITTVQDFIAAGQFRAGELLIDPQNLQKPGSVLVFLEPLYENGLEGVTPGSSSVVNAYTSNHHEIADPKTGALKGLALHAVDATALIHALLLRIQALLLPIKTLVLSGH